MFPTNAYIISLHPSTVTLLPPEHIISVKNYRHLDLRFPAFPPQVQHSVRNCGNCCREGHLTTQIIEENQSD